MYKIPFFKKEDDKQKVTWELQRGRGKGWGREQAVGGLRRRVGSQVLVV